MIGTLHPLLKLVYFENTLYGIELGQVVRTFQYLLEFHYVKQVFIILYQSAHSSLVQQMVRKSSN